MPNILYLLRWPVCICLCSLALLCAHALKWPKSNDPIASLHKAAASLSGSLPVDSPVALRVVGLPEDYFNHLRYAMIPRPLELKMPRAQQVLLLTADSSSEVAAARLFYERPDLRLVSQSRVSGFRLAYYKPAS